jgi:hypothetical protein
MSFCHVYGTFAKGRETRREKPSSFSLLFLISFLIKLLRARREISSREEAVGLQVILKLKLSSFVLPIYVFSARVRQNLRCESLVMIITSNVKINSYKSKAEQC